MTRDARPLHSPIGTEGEELPSHKIIALLAQEIRHLPRSPRRRRHQRVAAAIELDTGQFAALLAA